MNPAIRTVLVFLGLLILVIAASLYFVRTTRTGEERESAQGGPAAAAQPASEAIALHPNIIAGLEALKEFRTAEARELFMQVPEDDPSYGEALKNLANIQWQEGDYEGALTSYSMLSTLFPNDIVTYINLSWAQYRLGLYADSELSTLRALEIAPDSVAARYNVAFFRLAQGDIPASMLAYHRAMRRDGAMEYVGTAREHLLQMQAARPDFPDVHYALAFFANSIGNRQLEMEELELYLAMDPEGPAVEVARARLAEAREAMN
jgi:tetratricopeptide (TPR) repeat protein